LEILAQALQERLEIAGVETLKVNIQSSRLGGLAEVIWSRTFIQETDFAKANPELKILRMNI
jgi:hypothetical protein